MIMKAPVETLELAIMLSTHNDMYPVIIVIYLHVMVLKE